MKTVEVATLPKCDFCRGAVLGLDNPDASLALYDGPTRQGPWAYMCKRHLKSVGYPKSENTRMLRIKENTK